jgi:hypothetical protein
VVIRIYPAIHQISTLPHITTKYILIFQNAGPEDKTIDVNCDLGSPKKIITKQISI